MSKRSLYIDIIKAKGCLVCPQFFNALVVEALLKDKLYWRYPLIIGLNTPNEVVAFVKFLKKVEEPERLILRKVCINQNQPICSVEVVKLMYKILIEKNIDYSGISLKSNPNDPNFPGGRLSTSSCSFFRGDLRVYWTSRYLLSKLEIFQED